MPGVCRSRTRAALVALFASALLTLATAWAGVWVRPRYTDLGLAAEAAGYRTWQLDRASRFDRTTVRYWHMQVSGQSISIPVADYEARKYDLALLPPHLRPSSLEDLTMFAWYEHSGFPFPALTCSIHWVTQAANIVTFEARGGLLLSEDATRNEPRALPLTPLWAGLLADIAIWAALFLALVGAIRRARAAIRARRGRCPACNYHLAGLAPGVPCPECGSALAGNHSVVC